MDSYYIDTNYFIRLLLADNDNQLKVVKNFFKRALTSNIPLYSSSVVFFEVFWVLHHFYQLPKEDCYSYLSKILALTLVSFPEKEILERALYIWQKEGCSLEDCYHVASVNHYHYNHLATFDKKLLNVSRKHTSN